MNEKKYYYSDGKEKYGPFTIDELKQKQFTKDTLFWYEGEMHWHPLTNHPSLMSELLPNIKVGTVKKEALPPPLPNMNVSAAKKVNFKRLELPLLIIWTAIHLFALLMSYTGVEFFNSETPPEKDKFWPFVKFTWEKEYYYNDIKLHHTEFNGMFYEYDWTEFALYVGLAWLIYLLVRLTTRKAQSQIQ